MKFALRRHQLLRLAKAGWADVLARPCDAQTYACLMYWATHQLPLVVTRQLVAGTASNAVALGLPAPMRWGRRRLALQVPCSDVESVDEFPGVDNVVASLPSRARGWARDMQDGVAACGTSAHVYGSYGWQALSGLVHICPTSDLDIWVAVDDAVQADAVTKRLTAFALGTPRLDGELMFPDGAAVAWREWSEWRAGRARAVMVKRLSDVELAYDTTWCGGGGEAVAVGARGAERST